MRWLIGLVAISLLAGASAGGAARAAWPGYPGRIAFYSAFGMHSVQADGSGLQYLGPLDYSLGPASDFAWSQDGRLAYTLPGGDGHVDPEILLWNGVGGIGWGQTDQGSATSPAWSPDGKTMLLVCKRDPNTPGSTVPTGICLGNPATGVIQLVVAGTFDAVAWSPDGNQIAYDDGTQVIVARPDGSHAQTLDGGSLTQLEWSPDSRMLIGRGPAKRIWVVDPNNNARTLITDEGQMPAWSPDGTHIVYVGKNFGLVVAAADGHDAHVLTDDAGATIAGFWPRWLTGVRPNPPGVASRPAIAGTPKEGSTLTASPGTWNGDPPLTYAYQWQRCDVNGVDCSTIAGATATNYIAAAADVGSRLRVNVTATNKAGNASSGSDATATIVAAHVAPRIARVHARWSKGVVRLSLTVCTRDADGVTITVAAAGRTHAWKLASAAGCRGVAERWRSTHRAARRLVVRVTDDTGASAVPVAMRLR